MEVNKKENAVYQQELKGKSKDAKPNQELAELLVKVYHIPYYEAARKEAIQEIEQILYKKSGANEPHFLEPLAGAVEALLGEYPGQVFQHIIRHKTEYPYEWGEYRFGHLRRRL